MVGDSKSTALDLSSPCPFFENPAVRCRAAFARGAASRSRRLSRCQSDDHDNCPLFLARLLRSSPVERSGAVLSLHLK